MKALRIDDVPKLIEMRYNEFSVTLELGCASGKDIDIIMLEDGVLYHNIRAQAAGRMRNELASLIARTDVYGPAIIAGRGGNDVSSQYVDTYMV
ncbi:MAG: hypothetical protein IJL32_15615 [Oscillospiraceae bacterium]|nr:hypothetical protein [Oscillospiraceae bacterium]